MVDEPPPDKPSRTAILAVAVCALLIRVTVVVAMADSLHDDPDAYRGIAENLRQHGVFGSGDSPTAFRPPLYPVLLAGLAINRQVTPLVVGSFHVLLGVATVVLTYLLACRWRLGRWSFAAAAGVTFDPILLNQSALVMTETLATFLATAGLFTLSSYGTRPSFRHASHAGIVIGLTCLCRPTFVPWIALSAVVMVLQRRTSIRASLAFVLVAALMVAPWMLRNYYVFGVPKATTTHGGYTVLLGNNPSFYRYLREAPLGATWDSKELDSGAVDRSEFEDDAFAYALARRYISEEPKMFVYACFVRVNRLWQLLPYKTSESESTARMMSRFAIAAWYSILFVLAMIALIDLRTEAFRSPFVWGLLLCVAFTAVHTLYWSNMRMRAPLMPFICLLAARGGGWLATRLRDRKP